MHVNPELNECCPQYFSSNGIVSLLLSLQIAAVIYHRKIYSGCLTDANISSALDLYIKTMMMIYNNHIYMWKQLTDRRMLEKNPPLSEALFNILKEWNAA
jgi:hypothetical protein